MATLNCSYMPMVIYDNASTMKTSRGVSAALVPMPLVIYDNASTMKTPRGVSAALVPMHCHMSRMMTKREHKTLQLRIEYKMNMKVFVINMWCMYCLLVM